jgi:hypothetical protein
LQTEKTKSNKSIPKEVKKRVQNQLENQKKKNSESMLSKRDFSK